MSTTAAETRQEQIARYVELDALDHLLRGGPYRLFDGILKVVTPDAVADSLGAVALWAELWPDEEGAFEPNSPEGRLAEARSMLLAAQLFETVSSNAHRAATFYRSYAAAHVSDARTELTAAL